MDGFFVDARSVPFTYLAVEAKSSILPTEKTPFSGHRHGILKQLITSLEDYGPADERFDFTAARDNLEKGSFTQEQRERIYNDLVPPGPPKLIHLGMAAINASTVSSKDDDFILTAPCKRPFDYRALVVADLKSLSQLTYQKLDVLKKL